MTILDSASVNGIQQSLPPELRPGPRHSRILPLASTHPAYLLSASLTVRSLNGKTVRVPLGFAVPDFHRYLAQS